MDIDFTLFKNSKNIKFKPGYCYQVITWKSGYQVVKISPLGKSESEDKGHTFTLVDPLVVNDLDQFVLTGLPPEVQVTRFVAKKSGKEWYAVRLPAPRDKAEEEETTGEIPFETEDIPEPKKEEKPKKTTRKEKRENNPLSK